MIKTVVFDFDGVLVESAHLKTQAFADLYAEHPEKLDQIVAYHLEHTGISRFVKFRHFHERILGIRYDDEIGERLGAQFSELVQEAIKKAPCVLGAETFLHDNNERLGLYVASGTPQGELRKIAEAKGLARYFKVLYGAPRQKADVIREIAASELNANDEILFVGDGASDRLAAHEAGVHFVLRRTAENEVLVPLCPRVIDDLTGLSGVLEALGG